MPLKSTLEEAKGADLLLHVVDASHPEHRAQFDTVNQLVKDLDMDQIPQAVIFNKKDQCNQDEDAPVAEAPSVFVSSRAEDDKAKVKQLLIQQIKASLTHYKETVPATDADRLYFLKQHTLIEEMDFDAEKEEYLIEGYKNNKRKSLSMSDIKQLVTEVEETLAPYFKEIEETAYINQEKVLNAFHHVKATESDLTGSTGYGYDDFGRDHLEEIYAHTFKAEDAIVRPQIISGTHAITLALQSTLKYGDELIYITGSPYDTLLEVIGVNGNGIESLKERGVSYKEVALKTGKSMLKVS